MAKGQDVILAAAASLVRQKPPPPPKDLDPEEAAQWYNITMNMPADWFPPETWHVLVELCRHICQSKYFYDQLKRLKAKKGMLGREDIAVMKQLTVLHMMETKMVTHLSVRLKIAQPAIYDPAQKRAARMGRFDVDRKPWELPRTPDDFEPKESFKTEFAETDDDPNKFGETFGQLDRTFGERGKADN
jgi:hypothetical protein